MKQKLLLQGPISKAKGLAFVDKFLAPTAVITAAGCYVSRLPRGGPAQAFEAVRAFDRLASDSGFTPPSIADSSADRGLSREYDGYLYTPSLHKRAVLEAGLRGRLLPHKTTRHIIPLRPVGVFFPLKWLRAEVSADEANHRLRDVSSSARPRMIAPSGVYKSRIYEETVIDLGRGSHF